MNLLNLRNPVTGDFVIAAPRAGGTVIGNDITAGSVGRRQSVHPPAQRRAGGIHAGPVHAEARWTAHDEQPSQRDRLLREVSRARSIPGSVQPGVTVHAEARRSERDDRAFRHAHLGREQGQRAARRRVLSEQLAPAGRSVPRPHERGRRRAESGDVLRQQHRDDAARPLHRPAGRHDGAILVRRAERQLQQAASSGRGRSATR